MEIEERTKDYDKIIQNNKLITRIYNELIRLEQEGLEYNNEYFMLLDLIKKYRNENEKIFLSYPLMDETANEFLNLINPDSNNSSYFESYDGDDEEYDEEETIYDYENNDELPEEYEDNTDNDLVLNIDYNLNIDEEDFIRFRNDMFYYSSISSEVNKNSLYADVPVRVYGNYCQRYQAIQSLYQNEDISLEEAEEKIDKKLENKIDPEYRLEVYEELIKEKLVFLYRRCCLNHSTMTYLLDEIDKADQRTVKDLLIVRKYKMILENKCLEDAFLDNPRRIARPLLYKKILLSMYSDEETRKMYFSGWEETFKNLVEVLDGGFCDFENCKEDEECTAHNITNKALVQAYTSMLFEKSDLHQVNKNRNKVIHNIKDKGIKKVVSSSKVLKRSIILSEKLKNC